MTDDATVEKLRYPLGPMPIVASPVSDGQREAWIGQIERLPLRLRNVVSAFTLVQWDTRYRPGGWTVRQLVHHLADSHMNAYTRFKLALTEDEPTIKPYSEAAWAELADTFETPPDVSLALLEAVHTRWVVLLRSVADSDWSRSIYHPEYERTLSLDQLLAQYAWHCEHHLRHITALVEREVWTKASR